MYLSIRTCILGMLLASPALAAIVVDASNDFLPTYVGPQGLDLDVRTTEATVDIINNTIAVTTTLGASVGTTTGAFYVFGFDRGAGTQRFVGGTPSVGAGVSFDLVLLLRPDGTAQINDLVGGTNTPLPAGSVIISGNTISSTPIPLSFFPSRGLASSNYSFNLWPRVSTASGNAAISDFAPDSSNSLLTVVPAPATGSLICCVALLARRRRLASML